MEQARYFTALTDSIERARTHRDAPLIVGTAVAYGVAVYLAISLTRNSTYVAAIWPANGILLAALLTCPRPVSRYILVAACFLANATALTLNGDQLATVLTFASVGPTECVLAFYLVHRACGRHVELTEVWSVIKFVAVCLAAPILPAAFGAAAAMLIFGAPFAEAWTTWYLSDSLGLLIVTPTIVLLNAKPNPYSVVPSSESVLRHFLLLTVASLTVFLQSSVPLLFTLVPISVLIAFRLGSRYAAMATLWLTVVSLTCTYQGWGPVSLMNERSTSTGIWVVQLFSFVSVLTSLLVAAEIAERDRLKGELERVSRLASERREQLDTALDAMSQGVCLFDRDARVVVRNSQFLEIYGLTKYQAPPGTSLIDLLDICRSAGAVPEEGSTIELDIDSDTEQHLVGGRFVRINQRVLPDGGVICTYTDFTAEKQAETELLHRTLHDVLTGLPNRRLLVERIDEALESARTGKQAVVMLLDIDYFKSVNDNLGHAAGDGLLRVVADRLRSCVREDDTIARLGGDEFALLLRDGDQPCDASAVARRILDVVRQPVVLEGKLTRVGMSIGIARPPEDGTTTDEILKAADVALYKAKRSGRGKFAFFDAAADAGACSARRLESELRRAIDEQEFHIVYQPITAGSSGDIAALEALVRWHHPELGVISPAEFIPLAEHNGLIVEIGDWVLEKACRDAASLPAGIKISVNLSRVQVSDRDFVARVAQILERTALPPGRLELEVTETAILDNETNACRVLEELRELGVSVAIDDFGVGQSALSCLRSLPIGRIKIDRSFVNDLATDLRARSIFVAVVSLAKSLGIKTTAEGIETEQQRIIAALAGCDHLQGYLLGRPQALENFDFDRGPAPRIKAPLDIAS